MHVNETLAERGSVYGDFESHAEITQDIKKAMFDGRDISRLQDHHLEELDMIAHKIGRIINGDPNYADSWHDIAGYATLAERLCTKN